MGVKEQIQDLCNDISDGIDNGCGPGYVAHLILQLSIIADDENFDSLWGGSNEDDNQRRVNG